jgi:hypothetical protein
VPVERIELPTFGLQNRCSTAELNRLKIARPLVYGGLPDDVNTRGEISMGSAYPPPLKPDLPGSPLPRGDDSDMQSLRKENARLRDLVVQLSRLLSKPSSTANEPAVTS